MRPWLFRLSLSHLTEFPGRTLLGILGIALGTAVYLSISLAAASALKSFQNGVTAVAGRAQWRLTSPGAPHPECLFLTVRRLPGVKAAAPVVELFDRGPSAEDIELMDRVRRRSAEDRQALLERFIEAGKPINLHVIPLPDSAYAAAAIARLAAEKKPEWGEAKNIAAWRHPLIDSLSLSESLGRLQIPLHVTTPIPPSADKEFDEAERRRQRAAVIASPSSG